MEFIERYGEYTYIEEKELYTEFFFSTQRLMEDTFLYLRSKGKALEVPMLMCMFLVVSQQLDNTGVGRGYLSFKSHLLGFLNYKNKDIEKYKIMFEKNFQVREKVLDQLCNVIQNKTLLEEAAEKDPFLEIVLRWNNYMEEMYDKLLPIQKLPSKVSYKQAIQTKLAHRRFRKMSSFHNKVFSEKNRDFFKVDEFRAYRMLVNFIYLILPNMGMSSRKRVEASYMLVATMEKE